MWKSSLSLAALAAIVVRPVVVDAVDAVSFTSIVWNNPLCTGHASGGPHVVKIQLGGAVTESTLHCVDDQGQIDDTTNAPEVCPVGTAGDEIECTLDGAWKLDACAGGIEVQEKDTPATKQRFCWHADGGCTAPEITVAKAPELGAKWVTGETEWDVCDPSAGDSSVKLTVVDWQDDSCDAFDAEKLMVTVTHPDSLATKVICLGSTGPKEADCAAGATTVCEIAAGDFALSECTVGLEVQDAVTATTNYKVCWDTTTCNDADETVTGDPKKGDKWTTGTAAWLNCGDDSGGSSGIEFYYVTSAGCTSEDTAINSAGSWLKGLISANTYTVKCDAATETVGPNADAVSKLDTTDLSTCTTLAVESDGTDDVAEMTSLSITDDTKDYHLDSTMTTPAWTEVQSCGSTGGGSMAIEFDTVVRISSMNCKATDIGRDYGRDGETTTTIDPDEAIEHDSLYIGGDHNSVPGDVKIICEKAAVGDAEAEKVEKTVKIVIPSLVNLRLQSGDSLTAIRLDECVKLSIERTGTTPLVSDEICFSASAVEDCSRTYRPVPSTADRSLDASKPPPGQAPQSDWIDVGGVGCNVASTPGTTDGPGGGSVMVGVSGVGMALCALFALMI